MISILSIRLIVINYMLMHWLYTAAVKQCVKRKKQSLLRTVQIESRLHDSINITG